MKSRTTPRAQWYDYTSAWWYFVTICTKDREHYFGNVIESKCRDAFATRPVKKIVQLTAIWRICEQEIINIWHRKSVDIHDFVVMPNHIHMIIIIGQFDATKTKNTWYEYRTGREPVPTIRKSQTYQWPTLWQIVASFKWNVTKHANQQKIPFARQSRYHDRIIRNHDEYERIKHYIHNNPESWENDTVHS